jgi:hypothetical protein
VCLLACPPDLSVCGQSLLILSSLWYIYLWPSSFAKTVHRCPLPLCVCARSHLHPRHPPPRHPTLPPPPPPLLRTPQFALQHWPRSSPRAAPRPSVQPPAGYQEHCWVQGAQRVLLLLLSRGWQLVVLAEVWTPQWEEKDFCLAPSGMRRTWRSTTSPSMHAGR